MPEQKTVYKVEDIQKELGIARGAAYALCNRPGFPAVRISPRRIVIPREAFLRWLEEQAGQAI